MVNILTIVLVIINLLISIFMVIAIKRGQQSIYLAPQDKKELIDSFANNASIINQSITNVQKVGNDAIISAIKTFQDNLTSAHSRLENSLKTSEKDLENRLMQLIEQLDKRMNDISKMQETKLQQIKDNTQQQIQSMREDNNKQLDKMRETVDEKLSKTINERFEQSFKVLSTQLESVYKSLGEMQSVASSVGNLTKVLSSVKTTGVFGEIQLGAILEQMLTKDQYEINFSSSPSREAVEYAIKFPGQEDGEFVYMPVDSKFPLTVYSDLYAAYENNDLNLVKAKKEQLKNTIRNMAKDINNKYIFPPKTTDFAIMFLPVEGLYAEVAKMGLIDELQNKYRVTIAGPTTMSALLNSLQMGFRTLAIQKKSGEVWKILSAVKTEFGRYNGLVKQIQDKFERTSKDFDTLVGTRSRMIENKLKDVEKIPDEQSSSVLGFEINTDPDESES